MTHSLTVTMLGDYSFGLMENANASCKEADFF